MPSLVKLGYVPDTIGVQTIDATVSVKSQIAADTPYLGFYVTHMNAFYSSGGMTSWSSP